MLPSDGWSSTRAERGTSSRNNREGTISENMPGLVVDGRARGKEQDDHDGVFSGKERGVATNVQQEQSIGPRTGYSHFGSQVRQVVTVPYSVSLTDFDFRKTQEDDFMTLT